MNKLFMLICLGLITANNVFGCSIGNPSCAYERKDSKNGTTMHFDQNGNLIARTKG